MTKRSVKKYLFQKKTMQALKEFDIEKLSSAVGLAFDEIDKDMAERLLLANRSELRRLLLLGQEKGWVVEPGARVDYAYAKAAVANED